MFNFYNRLTLIVLQCQYQDNELFHELGNHLIRQNLRLKRSNVIEWINTEWVELMLKK